MAEFKALGLVELMKLGEDTPSSSPALVQIRLKDNFEWFFSKEFKELRGDYMPGDLKDCLVRKKKNSDNNIIKTNTNASNNNKVIEDFTVWGVRKIPRACINFFLFLRISHDCTRVGV